MLFPSCTVSPPETACRGCVAGLEQPAEPGPGGGDSILSFWQPGLLCCGPKEGRSIQSPIISTLLTFLLLSVCEGGGSFSGVQPTRCLLHHTSHQFQDLIPSHPPVCLYSPLLASGSSSPHRHAGYGPFPPPEPF